MQTGITSIFLVDDLGNTPARVNRRTGELYINLKKWKDLTPDARFFVLLHEAGHVDQDTRNEILADNYAFYAYARAGKPLSKSIQALTRLLTFNNPQHYDRVKAQIDRAFAYDYHVNGNPAADPEAMRTALFSDNEKQVDEGVTVWNKVPKQNNMIQQIHQIALTGAADQYSDLFGIGKSKKARQEAKAARQAARADKKINKERTKGAAERARMGLEDIPMPVAAPAQTGKSNTLLYAGIGAAAVILVIVVMYFKK